MAIIKIVPIKDTTIHSQFDVNTGIDEILEMGVDYLTGNVRRILLAFDSNYINYLKTVYSGSSQSLNLFLATATNLPSNFSVETYQIDNSNWINGIGNSVQNDSFGITWNDYISTYDATKIKIAENNIDIYDNKDLNINLSGSLNYSYIMNIKDDLIYVTNDSFDLKYFSKDTNTIYTPIIDFKFPDSIYNNSLSGSVITKNSFTVSLKNNATEMFTETVYRINISVRYTYPERAFFKSSIFNQRKYLTNTSYYSIRDIATNNRIIDFDDIYTKISLDNDGNFFNFYTNNFEPNRYYAIDLKIIVNNCEHILKDTYIFKLHEK